MFKIKFSRHAKRRLNLYDISEETISGVIERHIKYSKPEDGKHDVVDEGVVKYGYPLKAVFSLKEDEITVITAYPLKKGLKA
jgi:hypothetical protein